MDFPIEAYMDEDACYAKIVAVLHPGGLVCPRCGIGDRLKVHRRHRAPVIDYRCEACGRVFNAFTGTEFHKTHRRPSEILLILRGISQGTSTARMARELNRHRPHLLRLRHRLQARAMEAADSSPLAGDEEVEADEMYQNAGEKRDSAHRPGRSATSASQPGQGPRHLGDRPAAGLRRRRSGGRAGPAECHRADRRRDAGHGRAACQLADGDGQYR